MFFTFFKLYKWYQIAQRITNKQNNSALSGDISTLLFQRMLGMSDHTQQILHDLTKTSMDI